MAGGHESETDRTCKFDAGAIGAAVKIRTAILWRVHRPFAMLSLMRTWLGIALGGALFFAAAVGEAERRVALVIGNDKYTHLPDLNNAGKDARDMAAKLEFLGFEVIARYNASERDMVRAMRKFSSRLSAGGTGLAFYAGHGVQADGTNYLIPADAAVEVEDDLQSEAVDVNDILQAMKDAGNPLNILILDACRNNPLPKRTRSAARGLAITAVPSGAKGTAILYAAGPGQTAQDGPKGGNGVFTGALLKYMNQTGWSLEKIFKATSRQVLEQTNNRQRPWQLVSLQGDFIFRAVQKATAKPAAPAAALKADQSVELTFWNSVKNSDNPAVLDAYLVQYPTGIFAGLARVRIEELKAKAARSEKDATQTQAARRKQADAAAAQKAAEAKLARERSDQQAAQARERALWDAVASSEDPAVVQAFIDRYPNGDYATLARARLTTLKRRAQTQSRPSQRKVAAVTVPSKPAVAKVNIEGRWRSEPIMCGRGSFDSQPYKVTVDFVVKGRSVDIELERTSTYGSNNSEYYEATIQDDETISAFSLGLDLPISAKMLVDNSAIRAKIGECDLKMKRVD